MSTYTTLIIDDERLAREEVRRALESYPEFEIVGEANNVEVAIGLIEEEHPDIIFLDIHMPEKSGFDLLEELGAVPEVVFTTAYDQYAVQAFEVNALDYLLKPIDLEELQNAIEKARNRKNQALYKKQLETLMLNLKQEKPKLNKICLSTSDGLDFIEVDTILYCKANGSYTTFIIDNKKEILVSRHLKEYVSLFNDHDFMRVHKSHIINLKKVTQYIKGKTPQLILKDGSDVDLSPGKKQAFLERFK